MEFLFPIHCMAQAKGTGILQFLHYLLLYLMTTSHLCTHVTNTSKMLGSHTKQTAELSTFMLPEVTDTHSSSFSPLFISVYIPFYLSSCPSAHHLPIYLPIYVSSHPSSFMSVCLSPCASFYQFSLPGSCESPG